MPFNLPFLRRKTGPGLHNLSFSQRIWLARQMRHVASMVGQHGWRPVPVEAPEGPSWVYTIGFDETLGHPELIIFDTHYEAAAGEFHDAFEQLRSGELTIEDGMTWSEHEGGRCVVRRVHPDRISGEGWFSWRCIGVGSSRTTTSGWRPVSSCSPTGRAICLGKQATMKPCAGSSRRSTFRRTRIRLRPRSAGRSTRFEALARAAG